MTQKMNKFNSLKKTTKVDFATYFGVIVVFIITTILQNNGSLKRSAIGLLVPICCYMSMAVSLNLTVGILGELSLGHAGFMSVGAIFAAIVGLLIGTPVLRLQGDYLAIVTLAFGEIIKELINCLIIGCDENGLHFIFNPAGNKTVDDLGLSASGTAIIKGAQGATGTATIATFTAGFILVMITLIVVLNLTRSRAGRAIMAIRDNRIAAQAIGLNLTKYKLMAFVTSAALAGAAGALYGLNYSSLQSVKFNFNTSILVLVFVVLGGLGNIWGSLVAAAALTILGVGLLSLGDDLSFSLSSGELLTLAAAVLYALHIVAVSHFSAAHDVMTLTVVQLAVSAAVNLAASLALGEVLDVAVLLDPSMWGALFYLVVLSSCVCMVVQNLGQAHVPPAQAALLLSLESVFAVVASVVFYGEVVTPRLALGFASIFVAVVVSEVGGSLAERLRGGGRDA